MDDLQRLIDESDDEEQESAKAAPKIVLTLKDKPPVGTKRKKTHDNYFNWTDECLYKLTKYVKKHEAHIKNKYSYELKYGLVMQELLKKKEFDKLEITWQGLKDRFKTEMKTIVDASKDSTNLSAKRKEPSAMESLMLSMAEEIDRKTRTTKRKKKGEMFHDQTMATLEHGEKKRGNVVPPASSFLSPAARGSSSEEAPNEVGETSVENEDKGDATAEKRDSGGKKSRVSDVSDISTKPEAVQYMDKVLAAISGLKDGGEDEEERELRKELLRAQIAAAKKAAGL